MIPATVAAPLYFRPIGADLYEVVRYGQASGRVRWTGTGFDAYSVTGERVAEDRPVMTEAAEAIVSAEVETFLASYSTPGARRLVARTLREGGHVEQAAAIEAAVAETVTPTTAVAVSRALRAAGLQTIAPETRFRRPGVAVMRSTGGRVSISVDLELEARSARRAAEVVEVLEGRGYVVEQAPAATTGTVFVYVAGRRA